LVARLYEAPTRRNRKACVRFVRRSVGHLRALLDALFSYNRVEMHAVFRPDELPSAPQVRSRRLFTRPVLLRSLVLASACVATVAFVLGHLSVSNGMGEHAWTRTCTGIGEVRKVALEDGSRIELTTQTCLEVRLSATRREVHLLQGEALFTVRHDKAKPFTVFTKDLAVEDLGTQFRMYLHKDETDVGVLQGEVSIRALSQARSTNVQLVRIGPGEGATGISTPHAVTITPKKLPGGSLERTLAWREGALEFHNESLRQAVADLNRYNVRQLVILDPAIENLSVGGRFQYSHFDEAALAMANALGIRLSVDASNPNILQLSGRQSRPGDIHRHQKPVSRRTIQSD